MRCKFESDLYYLDNLPEGTLSLSGTAADWLDIAAGIKAHKSVTHRRVALGIVLANSNQLYLLCPRNTSDTNDYLWLDKDEALKMAHDIEKLYFTPASKTPQRPPQTPSSKTLA